MDSDPAPKDMRFRIFLVSNTGWGKLKPSRVRICQRDRDQLEVSVILTNPLEGTNFLFNDPHGLIISSKAADKQNCRGCRRSSGHNGCLDSSTLLRETNIPL